MKRRADLGEVASTVNRANDAVHRTCNKPEMGDTQESNFEVDSSSDLRFFLHSGSYSECGTQNYEFGALTN
jgi:hypothetical protein